MVLQNVDQIQSQYSEENKYGCVFPFKYKGKVYNECTKGEEPFPWCSYEKNFQGVWKYCYDMKKSDWKCSSPCENFRGEDYPSCRSDHHRRMYCTDQIDYLVDSDSSPLARECPPEYRELSSMHTRCLEKSKYVTKEGLSSADKREIVQLHNDWRSKIIKPAKGMMRVYWDDELAEVAQHHASRCSFAHDETHNRNIPGTGKKSGQNIVKISGPRKRNISISFNAMFRAESRRWEYGTGVLKEFEMYGQHATHLTQIYLDHLTKVGCGFAECIMAERKEQFFVCNYDDMQYDFELKKPYDAGESCSVCPNHCTENGKLCDCQGRQCFNGGILNKKTCTCECKGFYKGDSCKEKTDSVKQENGCTFPFSWKGELFNECIKDPSDYYDFPVCSSTPDMSYETMIECKSM